METVQQVDVPDSTDMATEPALTFGALFGNKALLKNAIAAVIALVVMAGIHIPDGIDSKLADTIFTLAPIAALVWATINTKLTATDQAKATRAVTYAPQTVAKVAKAVENGASVKIERVVVTR